MPQNFPHHNIRVGIANGRSILPIPAILPESRAGKGGAC